MQLRKLLKKKRQKEMKCVENDLVEIKKKIIMKSPKKTSLLMKSLV